MSFKKLLLTASALALLTGTAFADGGPVPEPPAPPPEPPAPPPEPAPPPPAEPAPPPPAPFNHWYVAGFGGIVWADDFRLETPDRVTVVETDLDTGWGAGGAIGYRWESGYRTELEVSYRHNDGDIIFPFLDISVFDIDVDSLSVMLNVLYDFDLGTFVVPYAGVGLGFTDADMDIADANASDGWGLAYQFLGGLSVPMPNTEFEFFVDYRYLGTTGFGLDPFDDDDEYRTQSVMGGVRFNF